VSRTPRRTLALSQLLTGPAPVTLAGQRFIAHELQLVDVAFLERWVARNVPGPLVGLPPLTTDPDPSTRKRRLRAAYEAAKAWPPKYGSELFRAAINTFEGRTVFLRRVLRGLSRDHAFALVAAMTPEEWEALDQVASPSEPIAAIIAELDPDPPRRTEGDPIDWGRALMGLVRLGLTPREAGKLTISQAIAILSRGAAPQYDKPVEGGLPKAEVRRRILATRDPDEQPALLEAWAEMDRLEADEAETEKAQAEPKAEPPTIPCGLLAGSELAVNTPWDFEPGESPVFILPET
jgi:hypothetical protein